MHSIYILGFVYSVFAILKRIPGGIKVSDKHLPQVCCSCVERINGTCTCVVVSFPQYMRWILMKKGLH